jgi:hypothetical protein
LQQLARYSGPRFVDDGYLKLHEEVTRDALAGAR